MLGFFGRSRHPGTDHPPHWGDVVLGLGLTIFSVLMIVESMNGMVFGGLIGSSRRAATPLELWSWRVFWSFFGILAMANAAKTCLKLRARRRSL